MRAAATAGATLTDGVTRGVVLMATGARFEPGYDAQRRPVEQAATPERADAGYRHLAADEAERHELSGGGQRDE